MKREVDAVAPFLLVNRNVRGTFVALESGVADMLGHRHYAAAVEGLVGEACAAAALLAGTLRFDGRLSLQFQGGQGPLKFLVAQVDAGLNVRAMAKAGEPAQGDLAALMGGGTLALLMEPTRGSEHYQAVVEVRGATLAEALEGYFQQSEQLPTAIALAAAPGRLSGLLLQRLPDRNTLEDDEHWRHVLARFRTLPAPQLAQSGAEALLRLLYPEEDVRLWRERPARVVCRCSHASISGLLVALGRQEIASMLAERGRIDVTCEFCGKRYGYGPAEVAGLLAAVAAGKPAAPGH